MTPETYIEAYCHIRHNTVSLNGQSILEINENDFPTFIKSAYKNLEIDYSKFFKMDNLSKLAFIAAEVLFTKGIPIKENENIAIALSNRASSLDTDRKYQHSISDADSYYPSPAVFVYTLANICVGEISIRHQLRTENSFFIFDEFNSEYLLSSSNSLMHSNKADKVLCGWVDVDENTYDAFIYLVSSQGKHRHTEEEITRLYQST